MRVVPLLYLLLLAGLLVLLPLFYHAPNEVNLFNRLAPPDAVHWLGTDELGRDVLLRLVMAGRVSLLVACLAAVMAVLLGTLLGMVAAWRGGWLDALLMRVTDGVMALPLLPVLIILSAIDLRHFGVPPDAEWVGVVRVMMITALFGWTGVARLVRNQAMVLLGRDFIRAARALGVGGWMICWRHLLPNLRGLLAVAMALAVGQIMLFEAGLSFLGLGVQPPYSSWGQMLSQAQDLLYSAPSLVIWPGLLIAATILALNSLADNDGANRRPASLLAR